MAVAVVRTVAVVTAVEQLVGIVTAAAAVAVAAG